MLTEHIARTFDLDELAFARGNVPEQEIRHACSAFRVVFTEELADSSKRLPVEALRERMSGPII